MEFARQRTMTSIGSGTRDHLEAVIAELDHVSRWRPASDLFPVTRTLRLRVEQFSEVWI